MLITVHNEEEMMLLGRRLAAVLDDNDTVYLTGELGAGKTTLVRGIARGLGYEGKVTSPTFTLMNVYVAAVRILHFDFYRLEGGDLADLGLEDYLEREGLSLIEWPQAGAGILPAEALVIDIELMQGDYERERLVRLSGRGDRYRDKVEELKGYVGTGD